MLRDEGGSVLTAMVGFHGSHRGGRENFQLDSGQYGLYPVAQACAIIRIHDDVTLALAELCLDDRLLTAKGISCV
jgi:hypothetical protein